MTTHHMKMAKATPDDIAAAIELYHILDAIQEVSGDDLHEVCAGYKGYEDCVEPLDYVRKAFSKGWSLPHRLGHAHSA